MKNHTIIFLMLLLLLAEVSCQETKPAVILDAPNSIEEAIFQGQLKMNEMLEVYPGMSIAIGINDSIIWSEGFGYSDTSNKNLVKTSSQFSYYSLSKSITGMALIKLIETKQLDIEKPVTFYLPKLPERYKDVKIKHLISHTSGIRGYNKGEWIKISQNNCANTYEALDVFINDPLEFNPGTDDSYSSFGYVLLSNVIEAISGNSYIDFLNETIFEPMRINSITMDQSNNISDEVKYYEKWRPKNVKGRETPEVNNSCKFGAGGLVGTSEDFVKLHLKMMNNQLTDSLLTKTYYTSLKNSKNEPINYAFGLGDNISKSGKKVHSHSGSGMGSNGVFLVHPEHKFVIAILGNIESKRMNKEVGEISQLFLGLFDK